MATLAEHQANGTTSLKRGTTSRNLGAIPIAPTTAPTPRLGVVGQVVDKAAAVGGQTLNIGSMMGKKTAGFVANTALDVAKAAVLTGKTAVDYATQRNQNKIYSEMSQELSNRQDKLIAAYKSGKVSKENYIKALEGFSKAQQEISKDVKKISTGPTPIERAMAVTETAVNILTLGSVGLAEVGGKQAFQVAAKEGVFKGSIYGRSALNALVDEAATPLEKVAMKVPAVRALIIRNLEQGGKREAQMLAGETIDQYLVRDSRKIAVNLLIKRPIFYQSNVGQAESLYHNILEKDYSGALTDAAWLGSQMIEGGPIGFFAKNASLLKSSVGKLAYGKQSFIDEISKKIGNGNPAQIGRFLTTLEKRAPGEFVEAEKTFRILQETNLRTSGEDVQKAVSNLLTHYEQNGYDLASITPSKLYRDMSNWAKADELAQRTLKSGLVSGISPEDASKYVVVRWDQGTRNSIASQFINVEPGSVPRMALLDSLASQPAAGWGNNETLMTKLRNIVVTEQTGKDIERAIKNIDTGTLISGNIPKKVAQELAALGFSIAEPVGGRITPIVDFENTRKLVSAAIQGKSEVFDLATEPMPVLESIARSLEQAGLSPQAANGEATRRLSESVVANLSELGMGQTLGLVDTQGGDIIKGGQVILSRLQGYVENKKGLFGIGKSAVTDIRQLTYSEVSDALKVSKDEAKTISQAIMNGYKEVPLEFRGLGDKVVDALFAYNPLQKYYSRVQAALRYTYNPFFRVQERVETKLLAHTQASNLIWNKSRSELNLSAKVLDESGIFTSSLPGEAAQDQVLGRITANITQGQKRDLAGLAEDIAKSRGMTLQQLVAEHPDDVDDALRVVVQYPRKGILASPLARTMNLAFFPMRYNFKVTQLAAQALVKQPPSVQKAVLHSLFSMKDWLKSDEGIRWQSQHADAIQVLNWVTPVNSIQYTMNLLGHKPDSIGDLGQLGGLPLGLITQILDGQGILNLNKPYVNPKTGDVFPKYIPNTTKARAATAIGDLLNTMFTFPGRTLGLPGKTATIRNVVKQFIDTNGTDFEKRIETERLTPLQQKWVQVLKGDTSPETLDSLYNSPAPGEFNWYTLPPLRLPMKEPQPIPRRTNLPTKASQKTTKGPKVKNKAIPLQ